jgi:hypothetical protein
MPLKGLKINPQLHKKLKTRAADIGVPIQDLTEVAISGFLDNAVPVPESVPKTEQTGERPTGGQKNCCILSESISGDELGCIREFVEVLRSPIFGEPIQKNVEGFRKGMAAFARVEELEAERGRADNSHALQADGGKGGAKKLGRTLESIGRRFKGTGTPKKRLPTKTG